MCFGNKNTEEGDLEEAVVCSPKAPTEFCDFQLPLSSAGTQLSKTAELSKIGVLWPTKAEDTSAALTSDC